MHLIYSGLLKNIDVGKHQIGGKKNCFRQVECQIECGMEAPSPTPTPQIQYVIVRCFYRKELFNKHFAVEIKAFLRVVPIAVWKSI